MKIERIVGIKLNFVFLRVWKKVSVGIIMGSRDNGINSVVELNWK